MSRDVAAEDAARVVASHDAGRVAADGQAVARSRAIR
jgi:hypothetical protein